MDPPGLEEDDARSSVRWMLEACERSGAPEAWRETFGAWVQRRARREPVQYIVGSAAPKLGCFWDKMGVPMDLSFLTGLGIFQVYDHIFWHILDISDI